MRFSLRTLLVLLFLAPLGLYWAWELRSLVDAPFVLTCYVAPIVVIIGTIAACRSLPRQTPIIIGTLAVLLLPLATYAGAYYLRTRSVTEDMRGRVRLFDTEREALLFSPLSKLEAAYLGREVSLTSFEYENSE